MYEVWCGSHLFTSGKVSQFFNLKLVNFHDGDCENRDRFDKNMLPQLQ